MLILYCRKVLAQDLLRYTFFCSWLVLQFPIGDFRSYFPHGVSVCVCFDSEIFFAYSRFLESDTQVNLNTGFDRTHTIGTSRYENSSVSTVDWIFWLVFCRCHWITVNLSILSTTFPLTPSPSSQQFAFVAASSTTALFSVCLSSVVQCFSSLSKAEAGGLNRVGGGWWLEGVALWVWAGFLPTAPYSLSHTHTHVHTFPLSNKKLVFWKGNKQMRQNAGCWIRDLFA